MRFKVRMCREKKTGINRLTDACKSAMQCHKCIEFYPSLLTYDITCRIFEFIYEVNYSDNSSKPNSLIFASRFRQFFSTRTYSSTSTGLPNFSLISF